MDEKLAHQMLLLICILAKGGKVKLGTLFYLSLVNTKAFLTTMSAAPEEWMTWIKKA